MSPGVEFLVGSGLESPAVFCQKSFPNYLKVEGTSCNLTASILLKWFRYCTDTDSNEIVRYLGNRENHLNVVQIVLV